MATANVKAVITAEDRASKTISGVGASFGKLAGAVGVGNLAAQGFTKALDMVTQAGKAAITQAASFEQTRIGLENMLGSADKARVLLKDISKFAAETPFEFPELAQATRQLVAFGFSAEEAFDTMKQLGDVSAAVGAPINDLAYLMGTLKTQGRAFAIDIRQFAQRGIPIYEYLAKVLNTNVEAISEMITEGKIGFPEVQKAFKLMTAEGGKFHGTMAKQSQSLNGLVSTLKDTFGALGRKLVGLTDQGDVVAGGLFDRLRNATAGFIDALNGGNATVNQFLQQLLGLFNSVKDIGISVALYLTPAFKALWNTILESLPTWIQFYNQILQPIVQVLGVALVAAIKLVIDGLNLLLVVMKPVMEVLIANKELVLGLIGVWAAFKVAMMLSGALQAATAVFVGVRAQIIATRATLMAGWAMPAIVVAAALASLYEVYRAIEAIRGAINDVNNAARAAENLAPEARMRELQQQAAAARARGDTAAASRYANALRAMGGNALGGNVQAGVPRIVGEQGKEVFIPNQSGKIVPNHDLQGGGQVSINVNVGMYAGSEMEKRKVAEALFEALKDVAGSKNTTVARMMGA